MMTAAAQRDSFVPRYRPLLELGRGGMARVYLAESMASGLRKLVVLKVLNQELASDPDMREAFVREAEISARLNHPNIVNVYEVFEQGSTAVMVMQHLDGMALSEVTSRLKGQVPLKLHLHILCQLLNALHYFHELKNSNGESLETVHRDVSPHNVMVLHEGGVKVVDFGVAKVRNVSEHHTRTGIIKGKVSYMAPEQLLSCSNVDRRADVYSVGVMLWEAVAARRMWGGMDSMARMRAIVRGEVPGIREAVPSVSDALAKVIERALAPAPEDRFATAEEMQIELEQIAHTEGGYSLPRELATFMRTNFGDDRLERQRAIEKAVEAPEISLRDASWSMATPVSGVAERPAMRFASPVPSSAPDEAPVLEQRLRRPPPRGAFLAALCVAAGATALLIPAPRQAHETVSVAPVPEPSGQEARAPAAPSARNLHPITTPSVQHAEVKQEAVPLPTRHDEVGLPRAEQQDLPPASARPHRAQPRVAAPMRGRSVGDAEPAPAATLATGPERKAEPNADCDPPYRLDPGGVKVFKPQCF